MGNSQSLRANATLSRRATSTNEKNRLEAERDSKKGSDEESGSDTEFLDCREVAANGGNSDDDEQQNKIQLVDEFSSSDEESGSSLSALDRLLMQQRRERQLELQSIQEKNKRVTDGKHRRRLDRFFSRAQTGENNQLDETSSVSSDTTDGSGRQDRPGAVVLEVRGLFEAQPVTSVLQSNNFRSQLENIIRGNLIRQEREMETALRLRNAGLGGNAIRGRTLTDAFVPVNLHEDASVVSSSTHSSVNIHPPSAAGQYQQVEGIPTPPPPPPPGYMNQFAPIPAQPPHSGIQHQQAYQQTYNQYQNMPRPQPHHFQGPPRQAPNPVAPSVPQQNNGGVVPQAPWLLNRSNNQQGSHLVEDLQQVQRETIITEISNLVHSQMVTSTLESNFRGQLEVMLENRMSSGGVDGAQVMNFIQNLPRSSNVARNDFSHLGITPSGQPTGRAGASQGPAQPNGAWSNEMICLQQQMAELQNMVRVSFDLQLDLQRAIRQEVAAALHGATGGSVNSTTGAPADEVHPASEGHCIICLDKSVDSVLYQCGHMCVCLSCGLRLKDLNSHCPMCRAPIRDVIRAFKCHEK